MIKVIRSIYLSNRLFIGVGALALLILVSYFFAWLLPIAKVLFFIGLVILVFDILLLFRKSKGIVIQRFVTDKLSNGDENPIKIFVQNNYQHEVTIKVVDEVPFQFQIRDHTLECTLLPSNNKTLEYTLKPVKRGEYEFGVTNAFVSTKLGLLRRRYRFGEKTVVPVYPSYIQMRKYELQAMSNRLVEFGIKKIRRIGHNIEFEQIKEYVPGDDFRTINWRATARKNELMVNTYQDERSQQVYCIIDKSRVMQMPFEGMSLLDYAINSTLALSNIIIKKDDKAGLLTFQHKIGAHLKASKAKKHMFHLLEALYREKTAFKEADFSRLYQKIRQKITQRSLLLIFTNFEARSSMQRQLTYLTSLSKNHLVVVVFFDNTEVKSLIEKPTSKTREIYYKAIAENLRHEKKLIAQELNRHGIQTVLTEPQKLSIDTINKYLELKSRGMI